MLLVIDNSEQKPWTLAELDIGERITGVVGENLRPYGGDYSISGFQDRVIIERKSLGDFAQTFSRDWLRFRKQLWRMAGRDIAAIVVEATLKDVIDHKYESEAQPNWLLGRVNDCLVDHCVPVFFWGERGHAAAMAGKLLRKAVERG